MADNPYFTEEGLEAYLERRRLREAWHNAIRPQLPQGNTPWPSFRAWVRANSNLIQQELESEKNGTYRTLAVLQKNGRISYSTDLQAMTWTVKTRNGETDEQDEEPT